MPLVTMYVQITDPGAVGAGSLWSNPSTEPPVLKIRNMANTGWDTVGGGSGFPVVAPAVLASAFPLNADTSYHTVCSLVLGVGTWDVHAVATAQANGSSGGENIYVRLFDGTVALSSGVLDDGDLGITNVILTIPLVARVVVASGTTTISLQARTTNSADGDLVFSTLDGLAAGSATHLIATQIA